VAKFFQAKDCKRPVKKFPTLDLRVANKLADGPGKFGKANQSSRAGYGTIIS
jgi:hypothetical protein